MRLFGQTQLLEDVHGKNLCVGCGACASVCPTGAITMQAVQNAKIGCAETEYGFKIVSAQLLPGESGSGKLVAEARKKQVRK